MIGDATGIGNVGTNAGPITKPVTDQVASYLNAHGHAFNQNQLVLLEGGANDVLQAFQLLGNSADPQALANVEQNLQAAALLQLQNITDIFTQGARTQHVVVVNVPDLAKMPFGAALPGNQQQVLASLVTAFNTALKNDLQTALLADKIVWIDAQSWIDSEVTNASSLGFTVANDTACGEAQVAAPIAAYAQQHPGVLPAGVSAPQYAAALTASSWSLFCSPGTLKAANADQTYMFADSIHPTTALHAQFAQYVEQQIAAHGIGQ
jgi:phospholipase/lecithinase/hemolysin